MGSGQSKQIGFDAIVMAGDKGAYKPVYGENKALLEINGAPVISYVISALQRCRFVARIFVVGPREKLSAALDRCGDRVKGPKELVLVEQWESMLENALNTFVTTLPSHSPEGDPLPEQALQLRYRDKAVLILGADIPLLTPDELDEFIEEADLTRYDYILGMTSEEALRPYYPKPGTKGIHFAYFNFKDSRERQNNLHLVRVFRVINRQMIQKMYQFRYQKRWWNVLRLMWEMLRTAEVRPGMVLKFLLLHLCRVLDKRFLAPLHGFLRRFVDKAAVEQDVSRLIRVRLGSAMTTYGGAALDVDNEEHFQIICRNFDRWKALQKKRTEKKTRQQVEPETTSVDQEKRSHG